MSETTSAWHGNPVLVMFKRSYKRTIFLLSALVLAGVAEGMGIASILPVINLSMGPERGETALEKIIYDVIEALGLTPDLATLLTIVVVGLALKAALMLVSMSQVGFAVAELATDMRLSLLRALVVANDAHHQKNRIGIYANAIGVEALKGANAFLAACTMIAQSIQILVYLTLAFLVSWEVTVAALLAGVVMMVLLGKLIGVSRRAGQQQSKALDGLSGLLTDVLQGIKPLKAMAVEDRIAPLLETETISLNKALRRAALSKEAMSRLQEPILAVFLAVGLYFVLTDLGTSIDSVLIMALLFARSATYIGQLQSSYQKLVAADHFSRSVIGKIMDAETAKEHGFGKIQTTLSRRLDFRDVSFAYTDGEPVLSDVSLEIKRGSFTSLVGSSGAGKSTLVDLILGFRHPLSGTIFIDDTPFEEVDIKNWRRSIGYVPQDVLLFHDTILANVTLGDPDLTREAAEIALRAAGAWDFVTSTTEGIDAVVGERGTKLSGGQRQRIAIARAMIRHPSLLILDEPTTALDPETEADICQTLKVLSREVTVLAISHQRALIDVADTVYHISKGKVSRSTNGDLQRQA